MVIGLKGAGRARRRGLRSDAGGAQAPSGIESERGRYG